MINRRNLLILALILLLAGAGFTLSWLTDSPPPMPEAAAALESDAAVTVETGDWLVFRPAEPEAPVGFIFYPGGRVPAEAYAPYGRDIAAAGYLTVIVPMPLNLAFLDVGAAADVMAAFPEVSRWVMGGHSLGGVAATRFVSQNPGAAAGLALWGSIPARSDALADPGIRGISIYASLDGFVPARRVEATRDRLPPDTRLVRIEGGNHAQFGWYGPQGDEPEAQITRAEQQFQTVEAMVGFLESLAP